MPKIKVTYMREITEIIEWTKEEMLDFNTDNLEPDLGKGEVIKSEMQIGSISSIYIDGIYYECNK